MKITRVILEKIMCELNTMYENKKFNKTLSFITRLTIIKENKLIRYKSNNIRGAMIEKYTAHTES